MSKINLIFLVKSVGQNQIMSNMYSHTDMDMQRSKTSRHHMMVDPDESDDEHYDAWYDQTDEQEVDYESDFDKDEPEREVPTVPSSWEDANIGMVTLGRKTPSPKPVQLAPKSSPWKTLGEQRVTLRAVQQKFDAERERKAQMEREAEVKRVRDEELERERVWREEEQERKAVADRKAREEAAKELERVKAKEAAARFKQRKLEQEAELKRRRDEEAAVKEARAERRKAREFAREHELRVNRTQMAMMASPIKVSVAKPLPMTKPVKSVEEEESTDSESDAEDHAEMLALMQHKARPVTSKSVRVEEERKVERQVQEETKRKAREEIWTVVKTKSEKKPVIIKMGQESYRKTTQMSERVYSQRAQSPTASTEVEVRERVDEKVVQERLTKTRMCISVERGVKCPHGDNCRFAHSVDELQLPQCMFGCDCRFVQSMGNGLFGNFGTRKVCKFIHTGESKESYYTRTGVKPPVVKSVSKPVVKSVVKSVVRPVVKSVVNPPPKGWAVPPKITATPVIEKPVMRMPMECVPCVETSSVTSSISSQSSGTIRLCKYVMEGKTCPHKKCRFSHEPMPESKPESKPPSGHYPVQATSFEEACHALTNYAPMMIPTQLLGKAPKPTGAEPKPTRAEPKPTRAEPKPTPVVAPTPIPPLRPYKQSQLFTDTATTPFMPVIPTVQTIYVPESQYMLALEMAMKSGKNLRIEIAK